MVLKWQRQFPDKDKDKEKLVGEGDKRASDTVCKRNLKISLFPLIIRYFVKV